MMGSEKKVVYIDMDNVLVDFPSSFLRVASSLLEKYVNNKDDIPGIFALMDPVQGAVEAFNAIAEAYEVFILSTAPWNNSSAWSDRLEWVKRYLGDKAYKRLILTHHKDRNVGDYLIDDREKTAQRPFRENSSSSGVIGSRTGRA
jgi:5'-nucleotidase